jgi:hypothetical protein
MLVGCLAGSSMLGSSGCSCSERTTHNVSVVDRGEPACMWIIGTNGYFADGSKRFITDEDRSISGTACLCLSEEEFESESRHEELNDMSLEVCRQLAMQHDFVRDECDEHYEDQAWYTYVYWAVGRYDARPPGFTCEGIRTPN